MTETLLPALTRLLDRLTAADRDRMPVVFRGAADGSKRFWEFLTVNIPNKNTRNGVLRRRRAVSAWCDANGLRDRALIALM
jgi:hypothetical protein